MFNEIIQYTCNSFNIYLIFLLILSIIIDLIIGELSPSYHPVILMGKLIDILTGKIIKIKNKFSGILLTLTSTIIFTLALIVFYGLMLFITIFLTLFLSILFNIITYNYFIINYYVIFRYSIFGILISIFLSSLFSINLLINSSLNIEKELKNNLNSARRSISMLVSRDTSTLNEESIISASIESMTENITDSYVSIVFYYFLFSLFGLLMGLNYYYIIILAIFGAMFYRLINTLDAMVGYKNEKLSNIGWFPAHIDDILNYIPSRIAGFMIILSAYNLKFNWKNSYKIFRRDARNSPSPNSGFTMAPTAGALDIQLEKINVYKIGDKNKDLTVEDITKAVKLTKRSILFSTLFLILIFFILSFIIKYNIDFSFLNFNNILNYIY